ncbi:Anaerobic nitric oxide reductase flavorubredoxin [Urinicoccus massiliensis]|uniref:Anaerobic nitric oxide reductase flavorubredoxin n=1 Tax=Urinicoccus massiliensis TaxID=1723382 RepID=A0A8H2M4Y4_9FIRM|nr:FprA family A-type flavoprotein [Urinicoccus massiliensis]VFB15998.1 Anaerobic nitric oxide reductase flavorubredoxin [Urinicoccus massiliensis]
MYCVRKVQDDLYYVGGNDHRLALFENIFPIPRGVTYNSYLLLDKKTVLFDSVDWSIAKEYLRNVEEVLAGRELDYMVIHHMEPDHAGAIDEIVLRYPNVKIISSEQGFQIMRQIGYHVKDEQSIIVKEGDTISFGKHEFLFLEAPMVHWPEVILSFDTTTGTLFSADAFGSFGALDGKLFNDEVNFERDWLDDARRYYTNIVGKYGPFVEDVLKKASTVDIKMICPLHGPVWRTDIAWFIDKYIHWATYEPEEEGVMIAYASMYGNTEYAAQALASALCERGMTNVVVYDVSNTDVSQLISETFRLSHLVLASVTYNLGIYPKMKNFLVDLEALNVQNRTVALIENGSWACTVGDKMEEYMDENLRMFDILNERVTLNTSLNEANENDMNALADSIIESMKKIREIKEKSAE